jgi:hypothetical protein
MAWEDYLPTKIVDNPILGEMRFSYSFVDAMLKLWEIGLQHNAPNGCQPRWLQLVSDTCAPVQSCRKVHRALALKPGESVFEAHPCQPGEGECFNRWPASGWPPVGSMYESANNPCSESLNKPPKDDMGGKWCKQWLDNHTADGYNASSVSKVCYFGSVAARSCAKTCCLRQTFDSRAAVNPHSATVKQPFWKASQWSTLWYKHAQYLLKVAPEQLDTWKSSFVPDEHFAVNNLVVAGLPFVRHGLTHVIGYEWFANADGAHAITVDCSTPLGGDEALTLSTTFRNHTIMRMNRKGPVETSFARKDTCQEDGSCPVIGTELDKPRGDTPAAQEAIREMVGNMSDTYDLKQYPTFMHNAAVLGRAFGRKFAPGCTERLVQHQRSLKEGGEGAETTSAEPTYVAGAPCHQWVAANAPKTKHRCHRTRPLFIGAGEGKTGTTTLWYTLAALGLVSAHTGHVLRCNEHAIDKPLVQVFGDQPPMAHGQCHEQSGMARDNGLSNKYTETRNMLFDPNTNYNDLDWCTLFEDYDAVLDSPIPNLLPYIYQAFGSAAKVIVSVRDAHEWAARRREWSAEWSDGDDTKGDPTPLAWMATGHVGGPHPAGSGALITNVSMDVAEWLYVASMSLTMCLVKPADLLVVDYFKEDGEKIESRVRRFVANASLDSSRNAKSGRSRARREVR